MMRLLTIKHIVATVCTLIARRVSIERHWLQLLIIVKFFVQFFDNEYRSSILALLL